MKINRNAVYEKCGGKCAYCGKLISVEDMQVDHAIPKYRHSPQHNCLIVDGKKFTEYGLHDFRNLMPACRVCNNWKRTWTVEEFRHEIEMQITRLRKYSAPFRLAERYGLITIGNGKVTFWFEQIQQIPIC